MLVMKKLFMCFSLFVLLLNSSSTLVTAISVKDINFDEITYVDANTVDIDGDIIVLKSGTELQERAVGGVAVFLGGILVGWIVDGALIYATGASGGEWVARAFAYLANFPRAKVIYLRLNCLDYPPHSQYGCH